MLGWPVLPKRTRIGTMVWPLAEVAAAGFLKGLPLRNRIMRVVPAFVVLATSVAYPLDLTGTVTDTAAVPLEGAAVWMCQAHAPRRTETDAAGAAEHADAQDRPDDPLARADGRSDHGKDVDGD